MAETRFPFAFDPAYRIAGFPFGVTPGTAEVVVDDNQLRARFGLWRLRTELSNVTGTELTGPFSFPKTAGPPHLSFSDRGMTMATNGRQGVCISFRTAVPGIDPTGRIRHPGLTVTVADCQALADRLGGG